ncbi:MAG: hypothetical protein WA896_23730 [Spirulinaceae cyanobacterium]
MGKQGFPLSLYPFIARQVTNTFVRQTDPITERTRIKYRGEDPESGYIVEIWLDQDTKTVETAYPVGRL